ncbi:MAG: guanylate kinase [Tyzzerella sp.]|nr:guanylate kinase [Tyzzerella sp.]
MSKIFYLMGKSASGKDTIYKKIKETMPELKTIVIYTTRPIREGETEGVEYHFVDENKLQEFQKEGKVIELREYNTVHGIWKYFTVNDGQFDVDDNYIAIGTLESYKGMREHLGADKLVPIYIEVEDGVRLERALARERSQKEPKYEELCRRFLADAADFSVDKLKEAGITRRFFNTNVEKCVDEIVLGIREKL